MIIQKANLLEARHITVHAGAYPKFKKSGVMTDDYSAFHKEYYENILYENLKELISDSCGTLICLENYNADSLITDTAAKLIKNGCALYLTLDTAKMYTKDRQINHEIFTFYREYKTSIRELHIHDMNDPYGQHQIVGTGYVDFTLFREFMLHDNILSGDNMLSDDNVYMNFEVRRWSRR